MNHDSTPGFIDTGSEFYEKDEGACKDIVFCCTRSLLFKRSRIWVPVYEDSGGVAPARRHDELCVYVYMYVYIYIYTHVFR